MPKCTAKTKAGKACKAEARPGQELCRFHDPEIEEERREGQRRGGQQGKAKALPANTPDLKLESPEDVSLFLAQTISQVRRGELDSKLGSVCGYLASSLLRSISEGDFARRLRSLEQLNKTAGRKSSSSSK